MNKVFTVSLYDPDKAVYVAVELPADPYTVLDAWERLRPALDARVMWRMEDYGEFSYLSPYLQSGEDFQSVNTLAERLGGLMDWQRTAFEGLVRLELGQGRDIQPDGLVVLAEQTAYCYVVPEAADDAQLGRIYAERGLLPEAKSLSKEELGLLDFEQLGRRVRLEDNGIFTQGGYVAPAPGWTPNQRQEARAAPEEPVGVFRLELRHGERRAELILPALTGARTGVLNALGVKELSDCSVTAFRSRIPQIPVVWISAEQLDTLDLLAQQLMECLWKEPAALAKYKAVLETVPPASLEDALALAEQLDAYGLDRTAASPEDVARAELRGAMPEEAAALIERHLDLHGYGSTLIRQDGGQLTGYGLLTRTDGQPVQEPLPPQHTQGGMQMEMG